MKKKLYLMFLLTTISGCNLVQTPDGRIIKKDTVPPGVATTPIATVDVIDKVATDLTPLAPFVPYGSAIIAAVATGTGLYRKYKPQLDGFKDMVKAIEYLPQEAKNEYKKNIQMKAKTKLAVEKELATVPYRVTVTNNS